MARLRMLLAVTVIAALGGCTVYPAGYYGGQAYVAPAPAPYYGRPYYGRPYYGRPHYGPRYYRPHGYYRRW